MYEELVGRTYVGITDEFYLVHGNVQYLLKIRECLPTMYAFGQDTPPAARRMGNGNGTRNLTATL